MTDRVITCPECKGSGQYDDDPIISRGRNCPRCLGKRTIPDRRAVSAAERAVERIKATAYRPVLGSLTDVQIGEGIAWRYVLDIINEEAGNG